MHAGFHPSMLWVVGQPAANREEPPRDSSLCSGNTGRGTGIPWGPSQWGRELQWALHVTHLVRDLRDLLLAA